MRDFGLTRFTGSLSDIKQGAVRLFAFLIATELFEWLLLSICEFYNFRPLNRADDLAFFVFHSGSIG